MDLEKEVDEALQYFGISHEKIKNGFFSTMNTENMRKLIGVEAAVRGREIKGKIQINIHYDPDFPLIITYITQ